MNGIIQLQRATVAEHIRAENAKEWPAVYETFIQNDNGIVLRQMRGETGGPIEIGLAELVPPGRRTDQPGKGT